MKTEFAVLPLLWHVFAGPFCRYQPPSDKLFKIDDNPASFCVLRPLVRCTILCIMRAIVCLVLAIFLGNTVLAQESPVVDSNKQELIQQIKLWVAANEAVASYHVHVAAMDRRLKVPFCDKPFTIQYPYTTSKNTVQVTCADLLWKIFVSIKINQPQNVLVYSRDISANELLTLSDVKSTTILTSERGLFANLESISNGNEQYSLATFVSKGDLVRESHLVQAVTVYSLRREILKGEFIKSSDIKVSSIPLSASNPNQRFPLSLLNDAKALRDLNRDNLLSRRDFGVRHQVLMSTSSISRGQKINSTNTRTSDYYGDLPNDAALKLADIAHMEAIRNLKSDQLIRLSDVRPSAMFKKGDSVELTVSSGLLTVTVDMLALESGRLDQQVDLLNPESNETVRAIVTGPGKAKGL